MSAFTRIDAETASVSRSVSERRSSKVVASIRAKRSASAMMAALTTSASPARNSRSESVRSIPGSQITNLGCENVPAIFL